jgi:hypothetical protein
MSRRKQSRRCSKLFKTAHAPAQPSHPDLDLVPLHERIKAYAAERAGERDRYVPDEVPGSVAEDRSIGCSSRSRFRGRDLASFENRRWLDPGSPVLTAELQPSPKLHSGGYPADLSVAVRSLSAPGAVRLGLPPWAPHVRFRRVQTLVREGSSLIKLRNSAGRSDSARLARVWCPTKTAARRVGQRC